MAIRTLALAGFALLLISGCEQGPESPRGFSFPPGDVERGKQVFLYTGCLSCHVIEGVDSDIVFELQKPIPLGGEVSRVKTYGELVTAIINPSHKIPKKYLPEAMTEDGTSRMRNYNDTLTISQLIDLVTFLETQYELLPYPTTTYPAYYP